MKENTQQELERVQHDIKKELSENKQAHNLVISDISKHLLISPNREQEHVKQRT